MPAFADLSAKVERGGQWRGQTRETRRRTLARYAARLMGRPVDQIDRAAVLSVLGPVYRDKPATGKLLRGWVRGVLAAAQALGHVDVNAAGEVIDAALPKTPKARAHRRALPYADVPAALEAVEASGAGPAVKAAIRFTALTAVRSREARGATWGEVDLEAREWRVPASRMTAGAEHRVPLSDRAVAVLEGMRAHSDGAADSLIFPGVGGRRINGDTLIKALRRATGTDADLHGFRSSFRTWAAERSGATRDVAELALAHVVGEAVERSYARSDLFDQRRGLMDRWAAFVTGPVSTGYPPRSLEMSPATVGDYLRRAKVAGLELSVARVVRRRPPRSPAVSGAAAEPCGAAAAGLERCRAGQPLRAIDRLLAGLLLSTDMSVIAHTIADREAKIERLQAAIKSLTHVEQLLGASAAPSARPRRSSRSRTVAVASAESKADAKPPRQRRPMSAAEKKAVSERVTAYWAERRKKGAKK